MKDKLHQKNKKLSNKLMKKRLGLRRSRMNRLTRKMILRKQLKMKKKIRKILKSGHTKPLIDNMLNRKNEGKTFRTLGVHQWRKVAAEVERISKYKADEKMATKKWSNLKTRYKGWR